MTSSRVDVPHSPPRSPPPATPGLKVNKAMVRDPSEFQPHPLSSQPRRIQVLPLIQACSVGHDHFGNGPLSYHRVAEFQLNSDILLLAPSIPRSYTAGIKLVQYIIP